MTENLSDIWLPIQGNKQSIEFITWSYFSRSFRVRRYINVNTVLHKYYFHKTQFVYPPVITLSIYIK